MTFSSDAEKLAIVLAVAVVERCKQESMNGLSARKKVAVVLKEVAVVER